MLAGMLLHMIDAATRVNVAMSRSLINRVFHKVNDGTRRLVFKTIDQWNVVNRPQVIRLPARRRVKGSLIKQHAKTAADTPRLYDVCIEVHQVRVAVIESFGFHASSLSLAEQERDARIAAVQL